MVYRWESQLFSTYMYVSTSGVRATGLLRMIMIYIPSDTTSYQKRYLGLGFSTSNTELASVS
jgi:hypothetical protein